jgi:pimeloyl-ACP methyl ester carboxylesterase
MRPKIETLTRFCFYDRAGLGKSDQPLTRGRTSQDMVDDLHTLLTDANIPGPYVLVSHSAAGFIARLYADQYPDDVVGMVLVDSSHPDQWARWLSLLPPESPDESEAVKEYRRHVTTRADHLMHMDPEFWDMDTSGAQVRATGPLGNIPLVVLTQDVNDLDRSLGELKMRFGSDFPPELAESIGQEWLRMQKELAELSSNSTHIIVEGTGHNIPDEKPDAVVDAILQVIDSVQDK